jgi:hypothetical protein
MPIYLFGVSTVDISKEEKVSLLVHSAIYITDKTLSIEQAKKSINFKFIKT